MNSRIHSPVNRWLGAAITLLSILLVTGCAAVGPEYAGPDPALPDAWHTPLKDGLRNQPVDNAELARWWQTLGDPLLTDLIGSTLAANPGLKQAVARVRQSRASRAIASG